LVEIRHISVSLKFSNSNLAPEMVNKRPLGFAHDYWCLGVLLYEMMFNVTPFHAGSVENTLLMVKELEVAFPTDIECFVSEKTKKLVI